MGIRCHRSSRVYHTDRHSRRNQKFEVHPAQAEFYEVGLACSTGIFHDASIRVEHLHPRLERILEGPPADQIKQYTVALVSDLYSLRNSDFGAAYGQDFSEKQFQKRHARMRSDRAGFHQCCKRSQVLPIPELPTGHHQ